MTPPNESITRQINAVITAGLRPTPEQVAMLMGAIVRPSQRDGYVEYVKPDTGIAVGCVPRDPGRHGHL